MSRDFVSEMREYIELRTQGTFSAPTKAQDIVAELQANDPKLLRGWLELQAVTLVRDLINQRNRSERAYNRTIAGRDPQTRSVFRSAITAAEAGDTTAAAALSEELELRQSNFLGERYLIEDGRQKALGDMTRADLNFAADSYKELAKGNLLQEAFLRAIANKVKTRTVGEIFTEETIARMWLSLPGN
jgi:hypothetical protein